MIYKAVANKNLQFSDEHWRHEIHRSEIALVEKAFNNFVKSSNNRVYSRKQIESKQNQQTDIYASMPTRRVQLNFSGKRQAELRLW